MTTATTKKRARTFWQDFLAGLAGPAAVWAAESAKARRGIRTLVDRARSQVMELDTLHAVDATVDDRELDASLERAEIHRRQLRRTFDAMAFLAGGRPGGTAHAAELRRLAIHASEIAPRAVATSEAFKRLSAAIDGLPTPAAS